VTDVEVHEPIMVGGRQVCSLDGMRWPCTDVRLRPRALDVAEVEILDALGVGPGCVVHKRLPEGADYDGPGGIVVRLEELADLVNPGGFLRAYRVVEMRRGQPRRHILVADEIEPASVEPPNPSYVRSMARRLAANVGARKGITTGDDELELLGDAYDLLSSIAGG
jgi:hypothetical protein